MGRMFSRILIANRGEIACRVIRTARRMGIRTVAVYSDADAGARHVRLADEAVRVGGPAARDSYLDAARILEAARLTGAEAVHPGYGFLSEDADFAQACQDAGIVFIGPPVAAIRAMASKSAAKALMGRADVPLTPGYHGEKQAPEFLAGAADDIGYPVLIKASAGGGGKGMRRVDDPADFAAALAACKRESMNAFGDDQVLIEKYILQPRHIEIQVFGDTHGNVVHLFERDCSVQRRHQKVLEEAPAPGMSAERRAAMGQAAVEAARAVGYVGAGTVEFIATQGGEFYFMEMNTRLQVEHPVTEMITGLDLVEWQLRVASGEPLPLAQHQLAIHGHAIEARIYAEDPDHDFLPATGRIAFLHTPAASASVRLDTGIDEGDSITPWYDPMIAKLIVHGSDRAEAIARMRSALAGYRLVGLTNNVDFLRRLVDTPSFVQARLDTALIERERERLFPPDEGAPEDAWTVAALAECLREQAAVADAALAAVDPESPWRLGDGWQLRGAATRRVVLRRGAELRVFEVSAAAQGFVLAAADASGTLRADGWLDIRLGARRMQAEVVPAGARRHVFLDDRSWVFERVVEGAVDAVAAVDEAGLRAPMPGTVAAVLVEPGATVAKGTPLIVIEAMKMEHTISAPADGRVIAFRHAVGDLVDGGAELLEFEEHP